MDSLTLNSLYDEGAYRASQQPVYGAPAPNPFEVQDPFAMSNTVAPPPSVQMAAMAQQQANPFGPYQPTYQPQPQPQRFSLRERDSLLSPAHPSLSRKTIKSWVIFINDPKLYIIFLLTSYYYFFKVSDVFFILHIILNFFFFNYHYCNTNSLL